MESIRLISVSGKLRIEEDLSIYYERNKISRKFKLRPVTVEEVGELRLGKKPGLILKLNNELYYSEISKDVKLTSIGRHQCSNCSRCLPTSNADGGCEKIRDCSAEKYQKEGLNKSIALELSKRIEKYNFITCGIETINTKYEALIVLECTIYEKWGNQKKKINSSELNKLKLSILEFYKYGISL